MFNKLQAKLRNKKGFTLVELLIVIAVLGIIAAIAVPRFTGVLGGVKDKADIRAAELWIKEIEAEFMVENWTIADGGTEVAPVKDEPRKGYDGTPAKAASDGKAMKATISKSGTGYTITVTNNAGTIKYVENKSITSPIE